MTITLTREEAQQVLDALENLASMAGAAWTTDNPIETLRARLNAPEPEPVLQHIEQYRLQMAAISTAAIGYWKKGDGIHPDYDTPALRDVAKLYEKYDALYTAPPQREWQGLTDEEISELIRNTHNTGSFVRAIEAKLKEKNA